MRTIVLIHPNGQIQTWEQPKPLYWREIQRLVNGPFERISGLYQGRTRDFWVNENGIALRLPVNVTATAMVREKHKGATIVGPVVLDFPVAKASAKPSPKGQPNV
jgi:hypothetical protein